MLFGADEEGYGHGEENAAVQNMSSSRVLMHSPFHLNIDALLGNHVAARG